ncbi:hypothetical protein [Salinibacter altiplanensis]|uniref:hypothetical protein n=1 Tax=Salinibacter altiplanensis TaxID=1803181 RepID=UPI000C9F59BE|nr:hypothetical protein [Salinibacter altiplanensis]
MNDRLPSLPIEAREHAPYRSLYAAVLLQNVEDALREALPDDDSHSSRGGEGVPRPQHRPSSAPTTPAARV